MSLFKKFLGFSFILLFLLLLQIPQKVLAVTTVACDVKLAKVSSTNGDYQLKAVSSCNTSKKFKLSADLPGGQNSGWVAVFTGAKVADNVITIAANDNSKFEVKVTPPSDAKSGERNIIIHAVQTDNSTHKDGITVKYKVKEGTTGFTPVLTVIAGSRTCTNNSITVPSKLTWTHPNSAATYKIKKGASTNGPFNLVTTTSSFEYTIPTNQNGKFYVVNANGGANSNTVQSLTPDVTSCPVQDDCVTNPNVCTNGQTCNQTTHQCEQPGSDTQLNFTIGLDAIGTTGTHSVSDYQTPVKDPKHMSRNMKINIYNSSNQQVVTDMPVTIGYISDEQYPEFGKFQVSANVDSNVVTGDYKIKVTVPGYLTKSFPGFVHITKNAQNNLSLINLTAGDINGDNVLNISDYNLFASCSIFAKTNQAKAACNTNSAYKFNSDINDDGVDANTPNIDQIDYIYLLQEMSVQSGD